MSSPHDQSMNSPSLEESTQFFTPLVSDADEDDDSVYEEAINDIPHIVTSISEHPTPVITAPSRSITIEEVKKPASKPSSHRSKKV